MGVREHHNIRGSELGLGVVFGFFNSILRAVPNSPRRVVRLNCNVLKRCCDPIEALLLHGFTRTHGSRLKLLLHYFPPPC